MKKRGISPLIATVLIIGFTIVLAAAIFQWGGTLVEKLKGQSEEGLTKITCVSDVNIDIKQACDMINSVLLTVDNKGNIPVKGLTVRLIGEKTAVQKVEEGIDPFGAKKISATIPFDMRSNRPTKVEVFPRILVDGKEQTCESESRDIDLGCGIDLPDVNNNLTEIWVPAELSLVKDLNYIAESEKNQYNLNGIGAGGAGTVTITSRSFTIPEGFAGVTVGGWVGPGSFTFELDSDSGSVLYSVTSSNNRINNSTYIGNVKLEGTGQVILKATGTKLISISEIGLYE